MKKILKITLTTAMFVTNGFAATSVIELQNGGEIQTKGTFKLNNQTLSIGENKSLNVYGSIAGNGAIDCSKNGQVNVFKNSYVKDETHADAIKTACKSSAQNVYVINETTKGSIASPGVIVEPPSALNENIDSLASAASKKSGTDLFYVANSTGNNIDCIGGKTQTTVIPVSLGNTNASIKGLSPSGLVMTNKLKFTGNNSGYTKKTVAIGTLLNPAEVEYNTANSVFPVSTTVEVGSKLTFSTTDRTILKNNITVNGIKGKLKADSSVDAYRRGSLVFKGELVIPSGITLTLGTQEGDVGELNAEHTAAYPTVMSWPSGTFDNELQKVAKGYEIKIGEEDTVTLYYNDKDGNWSQSTNKPEIVTSNSDNGLEVKMQLQDRTIDIYDISDMEEGRTETFNVNNNNITIEYTKNSDGEIVLTNNTNYYNKYFTIKHEGEQYILQQKDPILLKTLTKDELAELVQYTDGIFTYKLESKPIAEDQNIGNNQDAGENQNAELKQYVRRAQYMVMQPGLLDPDTAYVGDNRLVLDISMLLSAIVSGSDFSKILRLIDLNGDDTLITKLVSKIALAALNPILLIEKQSSIVNTYLGIDKALVETIVEAVASIASAQISRDKEEHSGDSGDSGENTGDNSKTNVNVGGTTVNVSTSNSQEGYVFGIYKLPLTLDLKKSNTEFLILEGLENTGTFMGVDYDSLSTLVGSGEMVEIKPIVELILPQISSYMSSHTASETWQTFGSFKALHEGSEFKSLSLGTLLKPLTPLLKDIS